jgi:hypothetical protein
MADNLNWTPGTGAVIATDDVGGNHFQKVKLVDGTSDSSAAISGDSTNGLDVDVTRAVTPENRSASGSLTASGQAATLDARGLGTASVQLTGTWVATVQFEGTTDGTNWYAVGGRGTAGGGVVTSATTNDNWNFGVAGQLQFRVRCSAFTSGTIVVSIVGSIGCAAVVLTGTIPSGSNNIGDVDVLTLPALPAGTNNIGDVDVLTLPALPAGTNNIGDVDVLSVVPGTGATALGKAEDAAHTTGDVGVLALGVRRDADTSPVDTDGDYHAPIFDALGNLKVNIKAGAGSGGTAQTDQATFTAGTTSGTPIQGYRDDTSPSTLTEHQTGAIRATQNRALHVNLRDAAGAELAVGGGTQYDEDTAHVTADKLTLAGAVRRDTAASGVDADGDRATLNVNSVGRLYTSTTVDAALPAGTNNIGDVDVLSLPAIPAGTNNIGDVDVLTLPAIPAGTNNIGDVDVLSVVPGTGATALGKAEDDPHASGDVGVLALAVRRDTAAVGSGADGDNSTLNVNASGRLYTSTTIDAAIPAGTNNIGDVDVLTLPALPAGTNNIGDVDVLTLPNVTLAAGTNTNEVVGDAAHDAAVAGNPVLIGGYGSAATPTAVSADGDATRIWTTTSGAVNVADGGGSLTVDGTVSINAIPTGTNNIGDVDIVSLPNEGQQTMANSISVAVASDQSVLPAGGNVAHDAADAGNPVKVGHKAIAHGTNPTAVAANDRTDWYANRAGVPWVIGGHPNVVTVRANYTASQTDTAIVTVGAGLKIVVTRVLVTLHNATSVNVSVVIGFGTANTPTTTGVVAAHPGIPAGGGFNTGDGSGIVGVGADNEDLRITSGAPTSGSLDVTVSYYTVES